MIKLPKHRKNERSIGLPGAIRIGVGAIVGGGILVLAGVAYSSTGPSAIVAFALNGVVAVLTALSFAEMSTAFPESGGIYNFAKKVLSVRFAFIVGWVVWFAFIVASVLYALGFAVFVVIVIKQVWSAVFGVSPAWLTGRWVIMILSIGVMAFYTFTLTRKDIGGGQFVTIGKLLIFAVLIAGGLYALCGRSFISIRESLTPFFTRGSIGLFQAMGFTFIAFQGFDVIASVAGEIKNPGRTIPRAMLLSLGIALVIYLPLLFLVAAVGAEPGQSIIAKSASQPESLIAIAAQNYLGPLGFWFVIIAAIFSVLSALHANLFAASRVVLAMARDRTFPSVVGTIHKRYGTPATAVLVSAFFVVVILIFIPDVASAGAIASLIFLVSFALAHWTSILARRRGGARQTPFHVPWFPVIPIVGALACVTLALFQGITVPRAGLTAVVWLGIGVVLYLVLFARRARMVDAFAEGWKPWLVRLRGRSPVVLVPIANPSNAEAMVATANALSVPDVGRVLLLSVVPPPEERDNGDYSKQLLNAQLILRNVLAMSFKAGLSAEAMTTIAPKPWLEIRRIAGVYQCEILLVGLSDLSEYVMGSPIEKLMSDVDSDVVVLRAEQNWRLLKARRILVPVSGNSCHDELRARLLGSLCRIGARGITFLRILPENASQKTCNKAERALSRFAQDEAPGYIQMKVVRSDGVANEIIRQSAEKDLVILGLQRLSRRHKVLGDITLNVARHAKCATIIISRRG